MIRDETLWHLTFFMAISFIVIFVILKHYSKKEDNREDAKRKEYLDKIFNSEFGEEVTLREILEKPYLGYESSRYPEKMFSVAPHHRFSNGSEVLTLKGERVGSEEEYFYKLLCLGSLHTFNTRKDMYAWLAADEIDRLKETLQESVDFTPNDTDYTHQKPTQDQYLDEIKHFTQAALDAAEKNTVLFMGVEMPIEENLRQSSEIDKNRFCFAIPVRKQHLKE